MNAVKYGPGQMIHIDNTGVLERMSDDAYTCRHCGRSYKNANECPGCGSSFRLVVPGIFQVVKEKQS